MFLSLYTDKAKGVLTEQRFMKLTAVLEQEQGANQKRLHDLAVMQSRADAQESEVRTFIKEIRRYAAIEELDESVLNRLISKILIGEVKKVDGQKVQEVRIVYNFVGEIRRLQHKNGKALPFMQGRAIFVNTSYLKILARTEKVTHNSENCRKISD